MTSEACRICKSVIEEEDCPQDRPFGCLARRRWGMRIAKGIEESGGIPGRDDPESRFQNMFWYGPY